MSDGNPELGAAREIARLVLIGRGWEPMSRDGNQKPARQCVQVAASTL